MSNDDEPRPFTIPLPGPIPGFPPGRDVLYIRSEEDGEPREHEDMMIRRVPRETAMRFRAAAGGRALTYGQYLAALVALHAKARDLAEAGDADVARELEGLGLTTVTI